MDADPDGLALVVKQLNEGSTPMRLLLENGPFAGCFIEAEGVTAVPAMLWFNRRGRVTDEAPDRAEGSFNWVGKRANPRPVVDFTLEFANASEFKYDRTEQLENGFDGILRFSRSLAFKAHCRF